MSKLTARQQEIFDYIRSHLESCGAPPTRAEIARTFNFASPNAAESHLKALAQKGVITLEPGSARGIRVNEQHIGLPLIGQVAAGAPILAQENQVGRYQIDPKLFFPQPDYLLRVRGLSMMDIGILEGDLLAVHTTSQARDGQIVVARIEDDVTVKRLQRHAKGMVELIAENPAFKPIVIDTHRTPLNIEGIVVGVIRNI